MSSPSNSSPELNPQQQIPEQNFPQLEAETVVSPESYTPGAELQAERSPEKELTDDQVQIASNADDTTDDNSSAQSTATTPQKQASTIPDLADDVDVIEKAWVDKAKQIISDTKDDPHAQEKAFEQLQIEYHKKRYGRDIKAKR